MHSWLWPALGSAFFAALVAIFGKIGLDKVDSTLATTARAGIMFLTMLAVAAATGKLSVIGTIQGKATTYIILAGVAGALSWLCYFWALKTGRASQVAALDRLSLIFVVAMAAMFLGEKIGVRTGVGALLMIAGAILVALG